MHIIDSLSKQDLGLCQSMTYIVFTKEDLQQLLETLYASETHGSFNITFKHKLIELIKKGDL